MGATEYVVLIVLAAVGAIVLYGKFGKSVGGKVDVAGKRVETLGEDRGGRIVEHGRSSGGGSHTRAAGDSGGGGDGSSGSSGSSGASEESSTADLLPERIEGGAGARASTLDMRIIVLLGILVVAVGALMILAVAQRVRKDTKKARR